MSKRVVERQISFESRPWHVTDVLGRAIFKEIEAGHIVTHVTIDYSPAPPSHDPNRDDWEAGTATVMMETVVTEDAE